MVKSIEKEIKKIEEKKKKLREKERKLKEKERFKQKKQLADLGRLFYQTKIADLDHDLLLGALSEISEKKNDSAAHERWRKKAEDLLNGTTQKDQTPLIVSFPEPPEETIRSELKKRRFKWNSFRGEYYGHGIKNELEKLLKDCNCKIEVVL